MPCYYSGKKAMFGRSHTHHRGVAGGRWKKRAQKTQRIFKPNLIKVKIIENGSVKSVKLAAKVLKRIKKDILDGKRPFLTLASHYFASGLRLPEKKNSFAQAE